MAQLLILNFIGRNEGRIEASKNSRIDYWWRGKTYYIILLLGIHFLAFRRILLLYII